jgi:hypothetical protein
MSAVIRQPRAMEVIAAPVMRDRRATHDPLFRALAALGPDKAIAVDTGGNAKSCSVCLYQAAKRRGMRISVSFDPNSPRVFVRLKAEAEPLAVGA